MHITRAEEAVFLKFVSKNILTGQISPTYTTNTRTKPTYGLTVPVDFVVSEYNELCDGMLTKDQALRVLSKAGILPMDNRVKAYA